MVFVFVWQLAKKYHPDSNKDDPEAKQKFGELAEAYEVCSLWLWLDVMMYFIMACFNNQCWF